MTGLLTWRTSKTVARSHILANVDSGMGASDFAQWVEQCSDSKLVSGRGAYGSVPPHGIRDRDTWVRIRGLPWPDKSGTNHDTVAAARHGLLRLRQLGYSVLVNDGIGGTIWTRGTRSAPGKNLLPLDLREGYSRAIRLGQAYGDLVDTWEIENEPELIYVPENIEHYAAYLKVCYLGLKVGIELNTEQKLRTAVGAAKQLNDARHEPRNPNPGDLPTPYSGEADRHYRNILMAPLGLPPGPQFELLLRNELLSYTDGFNFHFYGYPEDFQSVYHLFACSVVTGGAGIGNAIHRDGDSGLIARQFPVYISEYGYGLLSRTSANTVAGRVRQWRAFKSMATQASELGISAPMAFYLLPYFEEGQHEFGLSTANSSLQFQPQDFGLSQLEPWMKNIGQELGRFRASPALAWLMSHALEPHPVKTWIGTVPPASPVVMDLVAGADMTAAKLWAGYILTGNGSTGRAQLRLYNFSGKAISGRLRLGPGAKVHNAADSDNAMVLAPGDMRTVDLDLTASASHYGATEWAARFESLAAPSSNADTQSVFVTRLFADPDFNQAYVVATLDHSAELAAGHSQLLLSRPLASEEPPLGQQGRWLVTKGVTVTEEGGVWRFRVTGFPDQPLAKAVAQLPLPAGFVQPPGTFLRISMRVISTADSLQQPGVEPRSDPKYSVNGKEPLSVFWRSENGNLYNLMYLQHYGPEWVHNALSVEAAQLWTKGRYSAPWRFAENNLAALELEFRPVHLPVTFELSNVAIVRYEPKPTN